MFMVLEWSLFQTQAFFLDSSAFRGSMTYFKSGLKSSKWFKKPMKPGKFVRSLGSRKFLMSSIFFGTGLIPCLLTSNYIGFNSAPSTKTAICTFSLASLQPLCNGLFDHQSLGSQHDLFNTFTLPASWQSPTLVLSLHWGHYSQSATISVPIPL